MEDRFSDERCTYQCQRKSTVLYKVLVRSNWTLTSFVTTVQGYKKVIDVKQRVRI